MNDPNTPVIFAILIIRHKCLNWKENCLFAEEKTRKNKTRKKIIIHRTGSIVHES